LQNARDGQFFGPPTDRVQALIGQSAVRDAAKQALPNESKNYLDATLDTRTAG
jgi:hypothetical protein